MKELKKDSMFEYFLFGQEYISIFTYGLDYVCNLICNFRKFLGIYIYSSCNEHANPEALPNLSNVLPLYYCLFQNSFLYLYIMSIYVCVCVYQIINSSYLAEGVMSD